MIRSKPGSLRKQGWIRRLAILLPLGLSACSTEPVPDEPLFLSPTNFPPTVYRFENNTLTKEGVALGRMLFYDGRLSRDGTIACAECHNQAYAFTHHGHDVSHGIDNRLGTRNSLPLQNLAWSREFMWDGGVFDLDLFPIVPIENHVEMDDKIANVLDKLRADDTYRQQFRKAYGTGEITTARFLQALSQFMLTMVSGNSRYDKYVRNETGATLTADEQAGLNLFKSKGCASCHAGELFTDQSYRNNGLSLAFGEDEGRAHITEKAEDKYTFKVPSLRNVEHTGPYMHDGRFRTLEAVLNHYAEGVDDTPNLDPLLKPNSRPGQSRPGIPLTAAEQTKLIAFLKTLTDTEFLTNPEFAPK
ncbi:cytochrome-c peroxidase [Spirosoma sp. KUDC1026]|uniref:cytochrome-c peroxidase n=1 Tax=Spirosoma sp. KUDC1026 TaxID=2745947 RepID=UPI00159B96E0|nr:cytochrome c peroxidase [Spirosoma sp. KUDC1026]QKZ14099.1 cytochrome-c peroxidase [Spirosoma sp. KUDC1026]